MSISPARRSQVTLHVGGEVSTADRATLTRLLLEKGLEVSCRADHGVEGDGRIDPVSLPAAIHREDERPATAAWKPWFPVIDDSRCTNFMQRLSFCLFHGYGGSQDTKVQGQDHN